MISAWTRLAAVLAVVLTASLASADDLTAKFSDGPGALRALAVPLFAMMVIAITIFFAFAWYRVVTGKSNSSQDDD